MSALQLQTPFCDLVGTRHPLVLAPMAGGPGTPELVAAVTRAGGLGTLGLAGLSPEEARAAVARALELAGPPIGVNVQLAPREPATAPAEAVDALLDPFRGELGVAGRRAGAPPAAAPIELLRVGLEAGATVASVALGDPQEAVAVARAAGVPLLAAASTVEEARRCAEAGADAVVAQGAEAGGHRTTFAPAPGGPPLIGTFSLVPLVVDAVDLPVIAAGGVMDGRGLAAALALGAAGVQMGTRFLFAEEAGVPPAYLARLLSARDQDTFVTDAVTGRPARWLRNRLTQGLAGVGGHLGWGDQRAAIAEVARAAAQAGEPDLLPMLSGQGAALVREVAPAAEIVDQVVRGAIEALSRAAGPS